MLSAIDSPVADRHPPPFYRPFFIMSAEAALQTPHHVLRVVRRLAVDGASVLAFPPLC